MWYLETDINYTSFAQEQTYSEARYFFQNVVQILVKIEHFFTRNKLKINGFLPSVFVNMLQSACVLKCTCCKVHVLESACDTECKKSLKT